jgi:hypothetical protein
MRERLFSLITTYIEHVQTKPESERVALALVGACIVGGTLLLVWLTFFFIQLSTPTHVIIPLSPPPRAQDAVDDILRDARTEVDAHAGVQSDVQTDTQTDETLPQDLLQRDTPVSSRDTPTY